MQRVEVTEASEESSPSSPSGDSITLSDDKTGQTQGIVFPLSQFQIRREHFIQAIDEQSERFAAQNEAEEARARKEVGRQRLIEMATDLTADGKPRKRGFRYWLARLFRLVP